MIEHKMLKRIYLKYCSREGVRQIAKILFSLWSLVKEKTQISRVARHREECGVNKNCSYLEVVDGNKTKRKVREGNTLVIYVDIVLFFSEARQK